LNTVYDGLKRTDQKEYQQNDRTAIES